MAQVYWWVFREICGIRGKVLLNPKDHFYEVTGGNKYVEFKQAYALRAGAEGTMSQTAVALEMRRARYRGFDKTHLQHVATATAVNLKRAAHWLMGYATAESRVTRFAALAVAN